jgi:hypothetical protein
MIKYGNIEMTTTITLLCRQFRFDPSDDHIQHYGLPNIAPICHTLFVDDMTVLAQNEAKMQQFINTVQEFETWSGIQVNTSNDDRWNWNKHIQ